MPDQEKIRVLIVDDIKETRDNIQRLLQFDQDIEIVGAARSGKEAIELSEEVKPDVVIMDINMPDMDGISATEAILRKVSYAQIVILSVQGDPEFMRRAMLVGARDFLTKPPKIDVLIEAIKRAGKIALEERSKASMTYPSGVSGGNHIALHAAPLLGKIVVVYSAKGGTGCTTISTNLALALNDKETKVILIDGNLQFGDVAVFFNEKVRNSIPDLTSIVDDLEPKIIEEVAIKHSKSDLHILAAPPHPELADSVTGEQFEKLLQYLRQMYNYIIVDTASYLTNTVQAALEAADIIILITTQNIPSVKNANHLLTLADASGFHRDQIILVMNQYDKRISISPERIGEILRQNILVTIPLEKRIVDSSINRGMPFMLDNKNLPLSKSIVTLAELTQERLAKIEEIEFDQIGNN